MRGQTGLPLWAAGVLAGLFVPVVVPFELDTFSSSSPPAGLTEPRYFPN